MEEEKMKKAFFYLLTAGLAVSMIANTDTIKAEGTYNSNATVEFTAPIDSVPVLDPETLEEDPDAVGTGDAGPLSLDYVSNLNFGTLRSVELEGGTYEAVTERPYIQVTDRRGPLNGWNVTASVAPFINQSNEGVRSLPGAILHFNNGEAVSTSPTIEPTVNQNIELNTSGVADNIAFSSGGELENAVGLGTWVIRWLADENAIEDNNNVTLEVPAASATAGTHYTEISWTLTNGPSGN